MWARDEPEQLLYSSNATGKWELYAWDRVSDTHRQVTDRPEGTLNGRIDPTGRRILWFDDTKGDEFGRWIVEPFEGGAAHPAVPDLPPAYSTGIALGRDLAVIGSAGEGGNSVYLVRPHEAPALLYAHRESAGVVGLSRDETLLCISHSEHGDSMHPALRVLDLNGRTVADLWDGPGRGLWAAGWPPVAGDNRLLVLHERHDLRRPLIWTPPSGDVREVHLDLPGEVGASWFPDGAAALIGHEFRGRSELYRLDLEMVSLDRVTDESGTLVGMAARPEGAIWYGWSSSAEPPAIRVRAATGGPADILLRPAGEPAPAGVAYTDYDAGGVHGFLAEPPGQRPHPTLFWIHGGPTAHDRDEFSPRVQAFVDHGFAVILVNYRGSSGYGRPWRDALQGNPGFTELEDIAKVHDWAVQNGIADPRRTALGGGSWGGYLTLLGLGMQPERWSLGIAAVPVADYVAAFEDEMEPLKAFDRALFGGGPEDMPDLYRERSPLTYIERVRAPVLVLAGENDPRCPIRQIDNYLTRLRDLEKPHEVYRYDAGHGSLVVDETIRHVEVMLAFASRYLGTAPPQ